MSSILFTVIVCFQSIIASSLLCSISFTILHFFRSSSPTISTILKDHQRDGCIFSEGYSLSLVMRKLAFCICENKDPDQLRSNCAADQRLCFRYMNRTIPPKFQVSSHLVWLYSLVCVGPGRKPRRMVFSQRGSFHSLFLL